MTNNNKLLIIKNNTNNTKIINYQIQHCIRSLTRGLLQCTYVLIKSKKIGRIFIFVTEM